MSQQPGSSAGVIEVAAGLVFHEGRLLITQRPPSGHLANLWEFPGGKRESDESFPECLHRELREELDIEVEGLELIEEIDHEYPEKTVSLKFFRCLLKRGTPRALECQGICWVTREQLGDFEFPAADARLLRRISEDMMIWETRGSTSR